MELIFLLDLMGVNDIESYASNPELNKSQT